MSDKLFEILWTITWQSAILAAAVGIIVALFGRWIQPRWRYLLWSVVLLRLLLPVLPPSPWGVWDRYDAVPPVVAVTTMEPAFAPPPQTARAEPVLFVAEIPLVIERKAAPPPESVVLQNPVRWDWRLHGKGAVLAVWLSGVIILAIRYGCDELRLYRQSRYWKPVDDPRLLELLERCRKEAGVRRRVALLAVSQGIGAAAAGFLRPKILLSEQVLDAEPERLRMVLLHELVHIRRFDPAVLRLTEILTLIHWINPAVWLTALRLHRDRELACDAAVLDQLGIICRKEYGGALLMFAELFASQKRLPGLVGVFQQNSITRRIDMMKRYKKPRLFYTVLGGLLVLTVAGFGLTKAVQKAADSQHTTPEQVNPVTETPPLGLFQTEINDEPTWKIRGRILLPGGEPAKNAVVFYAQAQRGTAVTDDAGYFVTEEANLVGDYWYPFSISGVFPLTENPDWTWSVPVTRVGGHSKAEDLRNQPPEKFVFPLEKALKVSGKISFADGDNFPKEGLSSLLNVSFKSQVGQWVDCGFNLAVDETGRYFLYLLPGEYRFSCRAAAWVRENVTITPDQGDIEINLQYPASERILLVREDGTPVSGENIVLVSYVHDITPVGLGATHYRSSFATDENGLAWFYRSPNFNFLDYQNIEKNEAAFVVLRESTGHSSEPIKMVVQPFARGKMQILDETTDRPVDGLNVEYRMKDLQYEVEVRSSYQTLSMTPLLRPYHRVVSNKQGEIELPYMVPGVEYEIRTDLNQPDDFSRQVGESFTASQPGGWNDFGVVKFDGITDNERLPDSRQSFVDTPNSETVTWAHGRVTNPDGKPVEGALLVWQTEPNDYWENREKAAKTDKNGHYESPPLKEGKGSVTVIAEGFAPDMKEVEFKPGMAAVDFSLKPGKTLEIRFVDPGGKPVPGVRLGMGGNPDHWWRIGSNIYNRSLYCEEAMERGILADPKIPYEADENGLYRWTWAPEDRVLFRFSKKGYMMIFSDPGSPNANWLVAGEKTHEIVMFPEIVASGTVVDDETGEPVTDFTAAYGNIIANFYAGGILWQPQRESFQDGRFEYSIQFAHDEGYRLRIDADGYESFISGDIKPGETRRQFEIRLKKIAGLSGTVLLPDGSPAAGTKIFVAGDGGYLQVSNPPDSYQTRDEFLTTRAGADGTFTLSLKPDDKFGIYFEHPQGLAWARRDDFLKDPVVRLRGFAKLEVVVPQEYTDGPEAHIWLRTNLGGDGFGHVGYQEPLKPGKTHYTFEKIVAGKNRFAIWKRSPDHLWVQGSTGQEAVQIPFEIAEGETKTLTDLTFAGTTVTGKITLPASVKEQFTGRDWSYNHAELTSAEPYSKTWGMFMTQSPGEPQTGIFHFERIPPGKYGIFHSICKAPEDSTTVGSHQPPLCIFSGTVTVEAGQKTAEISFTRVLCLFGDDAIVFEGGVWKEEKTGEELPEGTIVETRPTPTECGQYRLSKSGEIGKLIDLYDGTEYAVGKFIRVSNDDISTIDGER